MPYRFRRRESVADGARRIVREELLKAVAAADDDGRPMTDRVHDVRTACKKIRGVLRIVRPALERRYRKENAWFRDQARRLSPIRDAAVILEALDDVAGELEGDEGELAALRSRLECDLLQPDEAVAADCLRSVGDAFQTRLAEIDGWHVDASDFKPLGDGLADVYRRGRRAMRKAFRSSDAADWHDWRKQVKYHWYHVRLLRSVWKPAMQARRGELERLADFLGREHDLTILTSTVVARVDAASGAAARLLEHIDGRRRSLRSAARPLGERLFAESPKALRKRFRRYWKVWREDRGPSE